jgi:secreted PhoX family phosphatase
MLYVAFTKHGRTPGLTQQGVLDLQGSIDTVRENDGAIFAIMEEDDPEDSRSFTYFQAWGGNQGTGPFDVANPDNIMIDRDGGVWFGTDGNYGRNGTADALYYLDLDPDHENSDMPTYGLPFRVCAGPSDSESTGPCLSSDMRSLFFNVQHPGEGVADNINSSWPNTPQSR